MCVSVVMVNECLRLMLMWGDGVDVWCDVLRGE